MANPNTIPYLRYQDIQIPDIQLKTQFKQYFQTGHYAEALSVINGNIDQLQGKAFIASAINTITSALLLVENYYNNDVVVYLSNLLTQFQNLIDNFKKRGEWVSTIQYTPYNFVIYNNNIYMCFQQPPVNTLPTDENYWIFLGLEGVQGKPGTDVVMEYDWEPTTSYQKNDLVVYNGLIYVALKDNTGIVPGTDVANNTWLVFIMFDKGQIYVGPNPPTALNDNTIWFKTDSDPSIATTTNPIIGEFQRYYFDTALWDSMYPNTVHNWVINYDNYTPTIFVTEITIGISDWQSNKWSFIYNNLTEQSMVDILPNGSLNATQADLYNSLSINITNNLIELTASVTPSVSLPIRIKIII